MVARKRRRKRRALTEAIKRKIKSKSKPAKASKYIHHLDAYHRRHPDMPALIWCRVSGRTQHRKDNLRTQEKVLRRKLKARGIPVVGVCHEVGSGWIKGKERAGLVEAVLKALKYANTAIVAISTDRFLRSRGFTTNEPDLTPSEEEFEELKKLTGDVPLVTYLDPDMHPRKVRGFQSKWGQKAKGNKGGPPLKKSPGYKKRRRLRNLPRVLRLQKGGKNPSQIAVRTGIARSTVCDWIVKYGR
jgi:hypothetical protein